MGTTKRVNTCVVIDMATGAVEHRDSYDHSGPFAMCDRDEIPEAQKAQLKLIREMIRGEVKDLIEEKMVKNAGAQRKYTGALTGGGARPIKGVGEEELPKGHSLARCARYLYRTNNNVNEAINLADECGDTRLAEIWDKAMASQVLADGGALIPPEFSQEIIDELGAKAVVRKMGLTVLPMNSGSLTLPYFDTSATAAYVGENTNIASSQPSTAQLQLSDKTLAVLTPLSNSLLNNGGARVDNAIKNHLVRVFRRKEDVTFIRSTGSGNEPKGMRFQAITDNVFAANGTVNVANVTVDLGDIIGKLMDLDVDLDDGAGFLLSPRSWRYLHQATTTTGDRVWRDEMDTGMLEGFPYAITSQIPQNLGGGTESEVYFASFKTLVLGENETMEMEVFPGGAYHDGSQIVSGISQNQTVIRLLAHHDLGAQQRGQEVAVLTTVKWGV